MQIKATILTLAAAVTQVYAQDGLVTGGIAYTGTIVTAPAPSAHTGKPTSAEPIVATTTAAATLASYEAASINIEQILTAYSEYQSVGPVPTSSTNLPSVITSITRAMFALKKATQTSGYVAATTRATTTSVVSKKPSTTKQARPPKKGSTTKKASPPKKASSAKKASTTKKAPSMFLLLPKNPTPLLSRRCTSAKMCVRHSTCPSVILRHQTHPSGFSTTLASVR